MMDEVFRVGDRVETTPDHLKEFPTGEHITGRVLSISVFFNSTMLKILTSDGRTGWINTSWVRLK
jgi:hypothetical protein